MLILLAAILSFISAVSTQTWQASYCTPSTKFDFAANNLTTQFIVSQDTTIQNCYLVNFPTMTVTGNSKLTIINVTFDNFTAVDACLNTYSTLASINVTSSLFMNGIGMAVFSSTGGNLTVTSSNFTKLTMDYNVGGSAAAIYAFHSNAVVTNCNFYNLYANPILCTGAAMVVYGGLLVANTGTCSNITSTGGGCVFADLGSTIYMNDYLITNIDNRAGGSLRVQTGCLLDITRVTFTNLPVSGAPMFSVSDGGAHPNTLNIRNCNFINYTGTDSGIIGLDSGLSYINIYNSNLRYWSNVVQAMSVAGVNILVKDSVISDLQTSLASPTAIFTVGSSGSLTLQNVTFSNIQGPQVSLVSTTDSTLSLAGVQVTNINSSYNGPVIYAGGASTITLTGSNVFRYVSATNGALMYLTGASSFNITGSFTAQNVNALSNGGLFYSTATVPSYYHPTSHVISNVAAAGVPASAFAYLASTNANGYIVFRAPALDSSFFVNTWQAATYYQTHANTLPQGLALVGNPGNVALLNQSSISNFVPFSYNVPTFTVQIQDYFGNPAPAIQTSSVIFYCQEITQNADFGVETVRLLTFPTSNSVKYDSLLLQDTHLNTLYTIQVVVLTGLDLPVNYTWPSFNFTYAPCTSTQRQSSTASICYDQQYINTQIRLAMGAISFIIILPFLWLLTALNEFKDVRIIKTNSYVFLVLSMLGSIFSVGSITVQIANYSAACDFSTWMENIGFFFIFLSLIIKMYRIKRIFNTKQAMPVSSLLKDEHLVKLFAFGIIVLCLFLALWTVISPSAPVPTLVYNTYYQMDRCYSSNFSLAASSVRLATAILASTLAFVNRKVPSDFNEAKAIGFCAYNWVIFGTLIRLLGELAIVDANVFFIVQAVSVFVPNILTAVQLVGTKIYKCYVKPEEAKAGKTFANKTTAPKEGRSKTNMESIVVVKKTNDSGKLAQ